MRAMILAAGLGTRLRPLTYVMPKPVAPVLNRPIVAWIADLLADSGFRQVVTNVSYLPEQIRGVLGDGWISASKSPTATSPSRSAPRAEWARSATFSRRPIPS